MSLSGLIGYQYWGFTHSDPYTVRYDSVGILVVSSLLFELIRRCKIGEKSGRLFHYISARAFAIYFLHVCVMVGVNYVFVMNSSLNEIAKFIVLEVLGVGISIVGISIFEKIPFLKKYLFMIM